MAYLSGRPGEAAERWARAAAAADGPEARLGLCLARTALGRCGEALPDCRRCLDLAPAWPSCRAALEAAEACGAP